MTETLAAIDALHFYAGIVLWDDEVTKAANIVKYTRKWSRAKVREYCRQKGQKGQKGQKVSVVYQVQRDRP